MTVTADPGTSTIMALLATRTEFLSPGSNPDHQSTSIIQAAVGAKQSAPIYQNWYKD